MPAWLDRLLDSADAPAPLVGRAARREWASTGALAAILLTYANGDAWFATRREQALSPSNQFAHLGALVGVVAWAVAERISPAEMGLGRRGLGPGLLWGAVIGLLGSAPIRLFFAFPLVSRRAVIQPEFAGLGTRDVIWLVATRFLVGSAIFEEVVFRGLLQAKLLRVMRPGPALLVNSGVFAAWHVVITWHNLRRSNLPPRLFPALYLGALTALFGGGLLFGLVRQASGHLAGSILAHWLMVANIVLAVARPWGAPTSVSRYRFPLLRLLRIALAVVRVRPRSLGADAAAGLRGANPPPLALYTHYLPASGPFVVVGNHYERPSLWAGWGAMIVSATVRETSLAPRDLHWLMTDELLDVRLGPLRVPRQWIRAVFARFAVVYGFGLVSARETGVVGGAGGLRVAARYLTAGAPVGVLPEGTASIALCEARPGVGTFLQWLTRDGIPLVPVGIAERGGVLTATFGPPFHLPQVSGDKAARDHALCEALMVQIARLLPPEMWGHYRAAMEAMPSPPPMASA